MHELPHSYDQSQNPWFGKMDGHALILEELTSPFAYSSTEHVICFNDTHDFPFILHREHFHPPYGVDADVIARVADAYDASGHSTAYTRAYQTAVFAYQYAPEKEKRHLAHAIADYVSAPQVAHALDVYLLTGNLNRLRPFHRVSHVKKLLPAISTVIQYVASKQEIDEFTEVYIDDVLQSSYSSDMRHVFLRLGTGRLVYRNGFSYTNVWRDRILIAVECRSGKPGRRKLEENFLHIPVPGYPKTELMRVDLKANGDVVGLYKHMPGMDYEIGGKLERYYWEDCIKR